MTDEDSNNEEPEPNAESTESTEDDGGGFDLDLDGFDVSGQPDEGPSDAKTNE